MAKLTKRGGRRDVVSNASIGVSASGTDEGPFYTSFGIDIMPKFGEFGKLNERKHALVLDRNEAAHIVGRLAELVMFDGALSPLPPNKTKALALRKLADIIEKELSL
jgi:hypothetical protein